MENARFVPEQGGTHLTDTQRTVAEIAFFGKFLKKCNDNAQEQLSWLQTKEKGKSKEIKTRHVMGLIDAYLSLPQGEQGRKKFESHWGRKSDYLVTQVTHMLPSLHEERDQLFDEAKKWSDKDAKKIIDDVRGGIDKLPKEQRGLIYDQTDLSEEKGTNKAIRKVKQTTSHLITGGVHYATAHAQAAITLPIGAAMAETDLQHGDMKYLVPGLVASYVFWGKSMKENLQSNDKLLEEMNTSTRIWSKWAYDGAKKFGRDEKKAAKIAYASVEAGKEGLYYAWAFGGPAAAIGYSNEKALVFLTGANIGGALYEYGTRKITDKIVELKTREKASGSERKQGVLYRWRTRKQEE